MAILVTGGAGFIGSHTCVEMLNAGYEVIVVDNLCNASEEAIRRVEKITGKNVTFYKADIRDKEALDQIFDKESVECVIHFAGLKAVGESVAKPLEYYQNNIAGTLTLCDVMRNHNVKNIIFSSSATVYGDPAFIPITEECPKGTCTNPYGWTKSMMEQIMTDVQKADIIRLRSEGQSFGKIAAVLELSVNTVKSFCSRNKDSRLCYCCGTPIIQPPHTRQKKFCSNRCRMKWWYAHKDDVNRRAIYDFTCACCGEPFQAYGNDHRKYCSRQCYLQSRFGGEQRELSE